MRETRRLWLRSMGAMGMVLLVGRFGFSQRVPQPRPSPNAPNPAYPPGLDGPEQNSDRGNKVVDPEKQRELKAEVDKLYQIASELRNELMKGDPRATLSVTFVKKAEEAEKVAKQVKHLVKG